MQKKEETAKIESRILGLADLKPKIDPFFTKIDQSEDDKKKGDISLNALRKDYVRQKNGF